MSYKNKTKYNIEDVFLCVYKSITNKLELFVYKEKHCRLPKLYMVPKTVKNIKNDKSLHT